MLERRLRKAKQIVEGEKDKIELLFEESVIIERARENREHYSRMKRASSFLILLSAMVGQGPDRPHGRLSDC